MNQSQAQRDNLLLGKKITPEIASEYGKRGQPKSVAARKLKQRMATLATAIAGTDVTDAKLIANLQKLGIDEQEAIDTYLEATKWANKILST